MMPMKGGCSLWRFQVNPASTLSHRERSGPTMSDKRCSASVADSGVYSVQRAYIRYLLGQHQVPGTEMSAQRVLTVTRPGELLQQPRFGTAERTGIEVACLHGRIDSRILVGIADSDSDVSGEALHILVASDRVHLQLATGQANDHIRSRRHLDDRVKVAVRRVLDLHIRLPVVDRHVNRRGRAVRGDANVIIRGGLDFVRATVEVKVDFSVRDERLVSHGRGRSCGRFALRTRRPMTGGEADDCDNDESLTYH